MPAKVSSWQAWRIIRLTTISTGGFSTHDSSFGHFSSHENYRAMVWTATIFMVAGALPLVAFIRLARGKVRDFFGDIQLRAFAIFLVAVIVLIAVTRTVRADVDFGESLTHAAFNIVSIVTTTGFATEDYQLWGPFASASFSF